MLSDRKSVGTQGARILAGGIAGFVAQNLRLGKPSCFTLRRIGNLPPQGRMPSKALAKEGIPRQVGSCELRLGEPGRTGGVHRDDQSSKPGQTLPSYRHAIVSANSDTQGRPEAYAYIGPVIVPMISAIVPVLIVPIMNLSQVAVACRIDLYRRSLWHGLAWRRRGKNDTSRNGCGHGQYFEAKHYKILLFFIEDSDARPHRRITGYMASRLKPMFGGKDRS